MRHDSQSCDGRVALVDKVKGGLDPDVKSALKARLAEGSSQLSADSSAASKYKERRDKLTESRNGLRLVAGLVCPRRSGRVLGPLRQGARAEDHDQGNGARRDDAVGNR